MQQVTLHVAKTMLSKLIEAAVTGEEEVISRGNRPVVRLVAIPQGRFQIGLLKGQVAGAGPDFLTPMDADELALWEGRD